MSPFSKLTAGKVIKELRKTTEMANWEFYDDYEEVEGAEKEPSFSLYDFKKWLESQNQHDFTNFREEKKNEISEIDKESLKDKFKQKVLDKVRKKINKRLSEKKKK